VVFWSFSSKDFEEVKKVPCQNYATLVCWLLQTDGTWGAARQGGMSLNFSYLLKDRSSKSNAIVMSLSPGIPSYSEDWTPITAGDTEGWHHAHINFITSCLFFFFFFLSFCRSGFKLRALHLLNRHVYLSHSTSPVLCWVFSR
jgi:hypothetical protein